jgi:hypothetical protein
MRKIFVYKKCKCFELCINEFGKNKKFKFKTEIKRRIGVVNIYRLGLFLFIMDQAIWLSLTGQRTSIGG